MDLNVLKMILLLVMIALTVLCGLLPMKVLSFLRHSAARASSSARHKNMSLILCLMTCFSGGVFLGTCFLHLFPELQENISQLNKNYQWRVDYPLAELFSCLGFFFLFFLEEMVIILIPSFAHIQGHSHGGHGHSHGSAVVAAKMESSCCMTGGTMIPLESEGGNMRTSRTSLSHDDAAEAMLSKSIHDHVEDHFDAEVAGHCQRHCPLTVHHVRRSSGRDTPECSLTDKVELLRRAQSVRNSYGSCDDDNSKLKIAEYHRFLSERPHSPGVFTAIAVAEPERCETNCEKVKEDPPILMKSSPHAHSHGVRSITLVLALSVHSIIEGIALGVGTEDGQVIALFLSLMVHKLIVAFSVGLQLSRTHAHQLRWVVLSILILACMSPIGGFIGMIVQSATESSFGKDMTITILQGLAVGTFLYVTFFEVLLHERDNEHPNLLKLLVIVIGFSLIGVIRLFDSHDHSHGGHGHSHGMEMHNSTEVIHSF